jgi:hypothetical protein
MIEIIDQVSLREIDETTEHIKPLLAGKSPGVQGFVLADLTALWLSGHVAGGEDEQRKVWSALLDMQVEKIWELLELYAQERRERRS